MIKIVLHGMGRMGQILRVCACRNDGFHITGTINSGGFLKTVSSGDVIIDFSAPEATPLLAATCAERGKALVIVTTGFSDDQRKEIEIVAHAARIPIVLASNFSIGMNALFWLTRKAVEILGADYDLEVLEMHHRLKKDAPSGSAKTLAGILKKTRDTQINVGEYAHIKNGREGMSERTPYEIGVHSIRGGDVVGDHTVIFASIGERVELTHKASSRDTFAHGALRAAQWVVKQKPGLYDMQDVLGLLGTPD